MQEQKKKHFCVRTDFCIPMTIGLRTKTLHVCVCVVIPFILDVRSVDAPAGVTQEEGRTGFLIHLSAVRALIFLARRIQRFLYLVNREVEFCAQRINRSPLVARVTTPRFELKSQCQKVLSEPPGRPLGHNYCVS